METKPQPTAAELHTIWVTALRTGVNADTGQVYEQVQRALRRPEGFCCLGVICDIVMPWTGGEWEYINAETDENEQFEHYMIIDTALELPVDVMTMLGLDDEDPFTSVFIDDIRQSLAGLNDRMISDVYSFDKIADAIVASDWYLGDPAA